MKKMNLIKMILGLFTVLTVALLAACGQEKENVRYFQKIDQTNKTDAQITYYYKGDDVTRQKAKATIYYSSLGTTDKETVKAQFEKISDEYQNLKGVKEKATYYDEYLVEEIEIDFTKVDFKKLAEIDEFFVSSKESSNQKISMESSVTLLDMRGFKEVKDGKFESLK